jgi:hypothetical protein
VQRVAIKKFVDTYPSPSMYLVPLSFSPSDQGIKIYNMPDIVAYSLLSQHSGCWSRRIASSRPTGAV